MKRINIAALLFVVALLLVGCGGGGGGDKEVTITYNANGATSGSVPASQKTLTGQPIAVQTNSGNLERAGYIFDGWNYMSGVHKQRAAERESLSPDSDITLYARWVELPSMVSIPGRDIKMSKTEVTIELYWLLSRGYYSIGSDDSLLSKHPDNLYEHDKYPVSEVSWYEAVRFCNDLSTLYGLTPVYTINGKTVTQDLSADGFRLPDVEEWQYAAAGGEAYIYAGSDNLDDVAWIDWKEISWDSSLFITHPVAQKKANGYGLYDMSGNSWEWCWNVHPSKSNYRAIQGGSVCSGSEQQQCRVLYSNHYAQDEPDAQAYPRQAISDIGIRIVCKE